MQTDLRVPVHRVAAQLVTDDGTTRDGTLFLAAGESVADLLRRPEAFFPVEENGRTGFYARRAVACITVPFLAGPDDELGLDRRAVLVRLRCGAERAGEIMFATAPGARTLEVLNEAAEALVLYEGARVHHVVTAHVARVEEV